MKSVVIKVKRYDGQKTWWQEYKVETPSEKVSVLDLLVKVKEEQDPTLAVRYSCRMAICGSCGMVINGVPPAGVPNSALRAEGRVHNRGAHVEP
jgi:succinate dehydrogenase / fumarate reductase iron-sulfur subunit